MSVRSDTEIDLSWVVVSAICRTRSEHDIRRNLWHIGQRMKMHLFVLGSRLISMKIYKTSRTICLYQSGQIPQVTADECMLAFLVSAVLFRISDADKNKYSEGRHPSRDAAPMYVYDSQWFGVSHAHFQFHLCQLCDTCSWNNRTLAAVSREVVIFSLHMEYAPSMIPLLDIQTYA